MTNVSLEVKNDVIKKASRTKESSNLRWNLQISYRTQCVFVLLSLFKLFSRASG